MRRQRSALALKFRLLAACAIVLACGAPDSRPNVVIVLIDELRKDYADLHMAGVNAAASRGIVVEGMRSAAPWTYPSVISLMSGLYPQQHGADGHLRDNLLSRLDPDVPLLQRRLREAGYATAAFVTNPFLLDWNGFHTGFDHFDGSFIGGQGNRRGDESVWKPETMYADSVNVAVRAHFDASAWRAPEFTYIHYIDVHGPWRDAPFRPGYVEAIEFIDRKVMELYDYAIERYAGNVLFIVTSDHGRSIDDDLSVGYGRRFRKQKHSVHDYNLKIPFAILPSRLVDGPVRIAGNASNVDVVPTLLDWLGLEPRVERPGISLVPAIRGLAPLPDQRVVYFRNSAFGAHSDAVLSGRYKVMRFFDLDTGTVIERRRFDIVEDPRETRALERAGDAPSAFETAAGDHGLVFDVTFDEIDVDIESRLRELGYLGGENP